MNRSDVDEKVREENWEGVAELTTNMVEQCSQSDIKEDDEIEHRVVEGGIPIVDEKGGDASIDLWQVDGMELDELQSLLQRQTEVAQAVADQEQSAWKMLHMMCHLTKVIAEQEQTIMTLQEERIGAERKTAELSVDLRTQCVEITKLKQRYDVAEQQLSAVQNTVETLQGDIKSKNKQLKTKDATIVELQKQLKQEGNKEAPKISDKVRQDRERRLAEIRSFLGASKGAATPASPKYRPTTNSRLQALRAARDSRLQEIRGLLQKGRNGGSCHEAPSQDSTSVTSMSDDSLSDLSSVDSTEENEERTRMFTALQNTRKGIF